MGSFALLGELFHSEQIEDVRPKNVITCNQSNNTWAEPCSVQRRGCLSSGCSI